jgi:hypothetical protein
MHLPYFCHPHQCDAMMPRLRIERRKCQNWSSRERQKKSSGRNSKNSSRRAERNMNLNSNDPYALLLLTARRLYNELLFVVSTPYCISSSHVHRFTPLYSNEPYPIVSHCWVFANRAFSSCNLAHGESPFHSSLRTSLDGRVIRGRPNCSMV